MKMCMAAACTMFLLAFATCNGTAFLSVPGTPHPMPSLEPDTVDGTPKPALQVWNALREAD